MIQFSSMSRGRVGVALAVLAVAAAASSQQAIQLRSGAKDVKGQVKGRGYVDYRISAAAGQTLSISMKASSLSITFNILPPGSTDAAMHIGSLSPSLKASRMVPIDGAYTVRVYQMGAQRSEGRTGSFSISASVSGKGIAAKSGASDAKIKGTPYHASATAPCSIDLQPSLKQCTAFVIRRSGDAATVVFKAGPIMRRVLFVKGKPVAHDSPEKINHTRSGDTHTIRFGSPVLEEYSFNDALITGG